MYTLFELDTPVMSNSTCLVFKKKRLYLKTILSSESVSKVSAYEITD